MLQCCKDLQAESTTRCLIVDTTMQPDQRLVFTFGGSYHVEMPCKLQQRLADSANGAGKSDNAILTLAVRWMNLALSRSQKGICEAGTASISRGKTGMKNSDSGAQSVEALLQRLSNAHDFKGHCSIVQ